MAKTMTRAILASLLATLSFICLPGQTATEIIQRHEQATGLSAKLKVRTLTSIGRITQMGYTVPISIIQKRPDKYRFDVHLPDGRVTQAYDGLNGWIYNPYVSPDTLPLEGPALLQIKESANFDGLLHTYRQQGYLASFVGTARLGNQSAYHIKLNKLTGESISFYIDTTTFLVIKTEAEILVSGVPFLAESFFGDYRKTSGMTLPYFIQSKNGAMVTEIRIDTVRLNEPMEDFYFNRKGKRIP
ncbi:MAG: hypothetical protein R6V75_08065 [Bacteroidales bacterium]